MKSNKSKIALTVAALTVLGVVTFFVFFSLIYLLVIALVFGLDESMQLLSNLLVLGIYISPLWLASASVILMKYRETGSFSFTSLNILSEMFFSATTRLLR